MDKKIFIDCKYIDSEFLKKRYNLSTIFDNNIFPDLAIISFDKRDTLEEFSQKNIPIILIYDFNSLLDSKYQYYNIEYILKRDAENDVLVKKIETILSLKDIEREKSLIAISKQKINSALKDIQNSRSQLMKEIENSCGDDTIQDLYSRKYIMDNLNKELDRTKRHNRQFAVAVLEIKNLNKIREKYGELVRESLVEKLSFSIIDSLRQSDILGLYKDNTFIILLPEIIEEYTILVLERIAAKIKFIKIKEENLELGIGFTVIDKERSTHFDSSQTLVAVLEKLLYFSKKSNQTIVEFKEENIEIIDKVKEVIDETQLQNKYSLIWDELKKGRDFIEKLLPKREHWKTELNYSYMYFPFNFIGGDFFDFIKIDEHRTAILFCDVSGHGVSSALYITAIKFIFNSLITKEKITDPKEFMTAFNHYITDISKTNIFVATVFAIIDKREKTFNYSFGGGTSPLIIRHKDKSIKQCQNEGFVVGLFDEAEFESEIIDLEDGDIIFFYSDGIYEFLIEDRIISTEEDFFAIIRNSVADNPKDLLSSIYGLIQKKIDGNTDFNDDITLLAVECD